MLLALLLACKSNDDTDDTDDDGACGDVTTHDVTILAAVESSGAPAEGATVELVDNAWNPGDVLGTGTSDADGLVTIDAIGVTSVDGCWGTALDYTLEATLGSASGSLSVNSALHAAIDESTTADLTGSPIAVQ